MLLGKTQQMMDLDDRQRQAEGEGAALTDSRRRYDNDGADRHRQYDEHGGSETKGLRNNVTTSSYNMSYGSRSVTSSSGGSSRWLDNFDGGSRRGNDGVAADMQQRCHPESTRGRTHGSEEGEVGHDNVQRTSRGSPNTDYERHDCDRRRRYHRDDDENGYNSVDDSFERNRRRSEDNDSRRDGESSPYERNGRRDYETADRRPIQSTSSVDDDYHRSSNRRRYDDHNNHHRDDGAMGDYRNSRRDYNDGDRRNARGRRNNDDDDEADYNISHGSRWKQGVPAATVMVKMLPYHVDEQHLRQLLENEWQQRALVRVPRSLDGGGGQNRGFGFIEFPSIADATNWLDQHDGILFIDDTRCHLNYCHAKQHGAVSSHTPASSGVVSDYAPLSENATAASGGWTCESCSAYNYAYRHNCFRCRQRGGGSAPNSSSAVTAAAVIANASAAQEQEAIIARMLAADPRKLIRLNDNTDTLLLRNVNPTTTDEAVRLALQKFIAASNGGTLIWITTVKVIKAAAAEAVSEAGGVTKESAGRQHRRDGGGGTWTEQKDSFRHDNENNSGCYCFVQLKSVEQAQALHRLIFRVPLEIDGFRVTVVYAAVSLSTMFPSTTLPNSTHSLIQSDLANVAAATAQAALERFQEKKSTDAAGSGSSDSECVFDSASGYYYYKTSGLYYHPDTRLFYNPQTKQYLYYDAATNKYMPYESVAPPKAVAVAVSQSSAEPSTGIENEAEEDDKARAQRIAREMEQWAKKQAQGQGSSSNKARPAITVSVSHTVVKSEPQPATDNASSSSVSSEQRRPVVVTKPSYFDTSQTDDEEKPTVVGDIDSMLLVASSAGAGATPNMPKMRFSNAAGDAGCYGARKYMSRKRDQFGVPKASSAAEAGDISPPAASHQQQPLPVLSTTNFADYTNQICTLCVRQFKSRDILDKHISQSALHKQNLEALDAKPPTDEASAGEKTSGATITYRDRAAERRKTGADEPPVLDDRKYQHTAMLREAYYSAAASSAVADPESGSKRGRTDALKPLGSDNVGSKMLKKMNWQEGKGLGARQQGMVDPLEAKATTGRRGLGIGCAREDEKPKYNASDSYGERIRKLAQHRYKELDEKES